MQEIRRVESGVMEEFNGFLVFHMDPPYKDKDQPCITMYPEWMIEDLPDFVRLDRHMLPSERKQEITFHTPSVEPVTREGFFFLRAERGTLTFSMTFLFVS